MSLPLSDYSKELLRHLAENLKISETEILAIAIQRLHNEVFIKQEPDDGPLSDEYRAYLQERADKEMKHPVVFTQSLFD
ncbi:hypothetical protein H8K52_06780 [Undibacterium seohonense]|uniref:Uncharacterized protein n=1 Tax=Undibacterium seohonense TaxID=1344950 RepID=A0ABR6X2A3_9BURK|nr:hypothetical protein [Undibacterium seohonense]MBC3807047.1 hypothetical protein [Undibacterium seohonense]